MWKDQKGSSVFVGVFILVVIVIVGGAGYYFMSGERAKITSISEVKQTTEQSPRQVTEEAADKVPLNAGWKTYTSSIQKVSFEYPEGWFVREDSGTKRIYMSNYQGEFDKDSRPGDFQLLWLSTWEQEARAERESAVKNGSPLGRVAWPVTSGVITAGIIKINTYEYQTAGGLTLEAFWENNGTRFYATNATEVGSQQQASMVDILKKVLPTIKHQ